MAITKEVVVDQIEAAANHTIQVRFRKNLVEDGKVLSSEYHRTALPPGVSLASQMAAVNQHLQQMGWPACEDISRIEAIVKAEHTAEAVQAYRAAHSPAINRRR